MAYSTLQLMKIGGKNTFEHKENIFYCAAITNACLPYL